MTRSCAVAGCARPYYAKGWCEMHYCRQLRTGSLEQTRALPGEGYLGRDGYRRRTIDGRECLEHRYLWEQANGPIPAGYEIHHINHIRDDNRLENLQAIRAGEHRAAHKQKQGPSCSVDGCSRPPLTRNLCNTHYRAWWKRNRSVAGARGSNGSMIHPKTSEAV